MRHSVAIVGGGISGLAAAHRLREISPEVDVLLIESADRLGGVINTVRHDGLLLEMGADSFLTKPDTAINLCRRVGLESEVISTRRDFRRAFVVSRGALRNIPEGFMLMAPSRIWPILTTPILSPLGKLRLALECIVPRSDAQCDESLAQFAIRRFGREAYQKLIQPLAGGIYSADPNLLSMSATMPRFRQMEQRSGSITLDLKRSRDRNSSESNTGVRYGQFASLRNGMCSLVNALKDRLPPDSVNLETEVQTIIPLANRRWRIITIGRDRLQLDVDAVIVAVPAHRAATIFELGFPASAQEFRKIDSTSSAVLAMAYRREQIRHPLDGFGFVVPLAEQRQILSCSFSSIKFENRAPPGLELFRVFMGGECQPELLGKTDEELVKIAQRELTQLLKIHGRPHFTHVTRHVRNIPQYHVGHVDRISRIEHLLGDMPTLRLAGSLLKGGGVPGCVASGEDAAERVWNELKHQESELAI